MPSDVRSTLASRVCGRAIATQPSASASRSRICGSPRRRVHTLGGTAAASDVAGNDTPAPVRPLAAHARHASHATGRSRRSQRG